MADQKKLTSRMKIVYLILAFLLLVFPFICVSLPGFPVAVGRAMAVACFAFVLPVAVFCFCLDPSTRMIRGGTLSEPRFDEIRPRIEKSLRMLILLFGLFFVYEVSVPMGWDALRFVAGSKAIKISGQPRNKSVPLGGLWFLKQSFQLAGGGTTYYLFYSWEPLQIGQPYEFVVLPESKLILEFHKSGSQ